MYTVVIVWQVIGNYSTVNYHPQRSSQVMPAIHGFYLNVLILQEERLIRSELRRRLWLKWCMDETMINSCKLLRIIATRNRAFHSTECHNIHSLLEGFKYINDNTDMVYMRYPSTCAMDCSVLVCVKYPCLTYGRVL